jgi:hypothetical protein
MELLGSSEIPYPSKPASTIDGITSVSGAIRPSFSSLLSKWMSTAVNPANLPRDRRCSVRKLAFSYSETENSQIWCDIASSIKDASCRGDVVDAQSSFDAWIC